MSGKTSSISAKNTYFMISTLINFCTHDLRFLDRCIEGVRPFSSQIIIPVCDHFYNGTPENRPLLNQIYTKYPDIDFIEFAYTPDELYGTPAKIPPGSPGYAQHWHNTARLVGSYFLNDSIEWVLFVDVDEIFSSPPPPTSLDAVRFATYWYFKTATNRATVTPDGPLLVRREKLTHELLLDEDERMGLYYRIEGNKQREHLIDGKPIVHHYSWVRTAKEMEQKIATWGHHWERDWKTLLKEGEGDFVRGYTYEEGPLFWDPLSESIELPKAAPTTNVRKVGPSVIRRLELETLARS